MLAKSLAVFATFALAAATPVRDSCKPSKRPVPPVTGGEDELPRIPRGNVLKWIALGHGIQNYTCVAGEDPVAAGAVAVLYDATHLYPRQGPHSLATVAEFEALPGQTVENLALPLKGNNVSDFGVPTSAPFNAPAPLELPNVEPLPFLGQHLFDSDGVPTFYTGESEADADFLAKCQLDARVPAPEGASTGRIGTPAVDWLFLSDNGDGRDHTFTLRVTTAGGSPETCDNDSVQSVPYATYYWFYGPRDQ